MSKRVTELHCIMPIENIPSVLQHGILSYDRAAKLAHRSVAMTEIQDRRDNIQVPDGLKLHSYANLYFNARNPMMFKRKDQAAFLCVLRVSLRVLAMKDVVLTDQNASSDYARFLSPDQISAIEFDQVFSADWTHPGNPRAYYRHKAQMCAEVLVPGPVHPELIEGAYVLNLSSQQMLLSNAFNKPITINANLFFN